MTTARTTLDDATARGAVEVVLRTRPRHSALRTKAREAAAADGEARVLLLLPPESPWSPLSAEPAEDEEREEEEPALPLFLSLSAANTFAISASALSASGSQGDSR